MKKFNDLESYMKSIRKGFGLKFNLTAAIYKMDLINMRVYEEV
jgi:hypothetical protein